MSQYALDIGIAVEKYPNSWNAYDSRGEAYMNACSKKLAVENYEHSVKLNDENKSAIEQLNKIKEK